MDAIRLVETPRLARELHGQAGDIRSGVTLWVNPTAFLPVRLVLSSAGEHADYAWLKPTEANLANVRVRVPAGLREVRLPAGAVLTVDVGAVRK